MDEIDVTVYKIRDETKLYMYTSCIESDFKQIIENIMSKNKYKVVTREKIEKNVFQGETRYFGHTDDVPFFKIERDVDTCYKNENENGYYIGDDIYSTDIECFFIQTSDEQVFINFLTKSSVWTEESEFEKMLCKSMKTQLIKYTKLHYYLVDLIGNYLDYTSLI